MSTFAFSCHKQLLFFVTQSYPTRLTLELRSFWLQSILRRIVSPCGTYSWFLTVLFSLRPVILVIRALSLAKIALFQHGSNGDAFLLPIPTALDMILYPPRFPVGPWGWGRVCSIMVFCWTGCRTGITCTGPSRSLCVITALSSLLSLSKDAKPAHFWLRKQGFEPATFGLWARWATRLLHSAIYNSHNATPDSTAVDSTVAIIVLFAVVNFHNLDVWSEHQSPALCCLCLFRQRLWIRQSHSLSYGSLRKCPSPKS